MAFLSNDSIKKYLSDETIPSDRRIKITPDISDIQIGQCSIDLELSTQFARFEKSLFSLKSFDLTQKETAKEIQKKWYKYITVTESEGILINPNEVVIAITREWVSLPRNMFGLITGRSSFSRMGIEVQLTQDLHQPGHNSQILLQIKNNSPFSIRLYPGMRIVQLMIGVLDQDCSVSYDENPNSKYKGGKTGISANWFQDFELREKEVIKSNYPKALLDAMLICLSVIAVIAGSLKISEIESKIDLFLVVSIPLAVVVLWLRIINFSRN